MATIVEQAMPPTLPLSRPSTPPMPPHITLNTSLRGSPAAVPNKHIPSCSPGKAIPVTASNQVEIPKSPTTQRRMDRDNAMQSLLYPPNEAFGRIQLGDEEGRYIYSITAKQIAEALEFQANEPLPDPKLVFPWLHGLHSGNSSQLGFFLGGMECRTPAAMRRRAAIRRPPGCFRHITLVKAGGNLQRSRLKGAISPDEILAPLVAAGPGSNVGVQNSRFMDMDPINGFNVRNFQIQTGKMASVGDVITYGDELTSAEEVLETGRRIAYAQLEWKERMRQCGYEIPVFNSFVLLEDVFGAFEEKYPSIVAIDSRGTPNPDVVDFFLHERAQMATMTASSLLSPNVFLGPTPDTSNPTHLNDRPVNNTIVEDYDILIEASDLAKFPSKLIMERLQSNMRDYPGQILHLDVPASGTVNIPNKEHHSLAGSEETQALVDLCQWIWQVSRGETLDPPKCDLAQNSINDDLVETTPVNVIEEPNLQKEHILHVQAVDSDGDVMMADEPVSSASKLPMDPAAAEKSIPAALPPPLALVEDAKPLEISDGPKSQPMPAKKVLIHCPDGYTETSLIALAYYMFSHGKTVGEAWVEMHVEKERNFFTYPTDVGVLSEMQNAILAASPVKKERSKAKEEPSPADQADQITATEEAIVETTLETTNPVWLTPAFDGSLPSRILPHLYLGNLVHAQSPSLLRKLGIKRIITVGERIDWQQWRRMLDTVPEQSHTTSMSTARYGAGEVDELEERGKPTVREELHDGFQFLMIGPGVLADNGVDGLMGEFRRCIDFIERGKQDGSATLVHCRVGVSRSATICIAYMMQEFNLSFPRAYCFVRARRLNVIIQPHLRFVYELLKWEEELSKQRGHSPDGRREMEWAQVCREIAAMNRPYSRG